MIYAIERLRCGHLREGARADTYWDEMTTRYVGMRVLSSFESGGPVHYNFQIAEMQFFINPQAEVPPETLFGWAQRETLVRELGKLRAGIEDLALSFRERYPGQSLLARLAKIETAMEGPFVADDAGLRKRFDTLRREALVNANPLVPEKLLFVKRFTYNPGWYYAEFMRAERFGGNLCVLDVRRNEVTELIPELVGGIFDRCDLSFDGCRVVFGYKAAPGRGFLHLIDRFGNRVRIHDDAKISCWQPIPLAPRTRPPVIPPVQQLAPVSQDEAVVVMSDVYRGLEGARPGTVKYLRVWEQVPRPWSARRFWPDDETHGQHAVISLNAHIFVKIHHGVVPVCEDGSAHFVVPARKNLFFQALDEDFMEVQRMRSFVNLQPGETRSCIGCHEPKSTAPPPKTPLALSHAPNHLAPQPGETVPRPIHYVTDVQPVLDKHCTRCHNPQQADGKLDLSGGLTTFFNRSYESIMTRKLVTCIQEFKGPQPRAQKTNVVTLPPYALGSHASRLIAVLRDGHHECRLSPQERIRLTTWIDANAPYYGSYFGRRNLNYRDHPDFRPTPTTESASGILPRGMSTKF